MTLTTAGMDDMPDVDAAAVDLVLSSVAYGEYATLGASDEAYIRACCDWRPDAECEAFEEAHGSDPWVLEYREGGRQFRTAGRATHDQIRQAFRSYLAGGSEWRTEFAWGELGR